MTDLGKSVIPSSQIPVGSLYKKTMENFMDEFADENMAELHFIHHQKRRVKNLVRLNLMIQLRGASDEGSVSMPQLPNAARAENNDIMVPNGAGTYSSTPAQKNLRKVQAAMMGIREQQSRSVVARNPALSTPYKQTLLQRDDLGYGGSVRYATSGRQSMNKSISLASVGTADERM